MDYQFILTVVGLIVLFLTIITSDYSTRSEIHGLRRSVDELITEVKADLEKFSAKQESDLKVANSKIDAVSTKLDNLLWRVTNKS